MTATDPKATFSKSDPLWFMGRSLAARNINISRILTLAFGALPTLLWLPLLAISMVLFARTAWEGAPVWRPADSALAVLLVFWAAFGLWGAYSIWTAAIGPVPVARSTALGLGAGIIAMLLMVFLLWEGKPRDIIDLFPIWLIAGPVSVAVWHIYCFAKTN